MNMGMRMLILAVIVTASFIYIVVQSYRRGYRAGAQWVLGEWKRAESLAFEGGFIKESDKEEL